MNIWCVGRNYSEHAKELGNSVPEASQDPMIFLKAGTTIVENGASFSLPAFSTDIHHECELAFRFDDELKFSHVTVALDLTARDTQTKAKEKGQPWTLAKSFKRSCPLGPFVELSAHHDPQHFRFTFHVNGALRQNGDAQEMIHSVERLRSYLIERFPVAPGDIVLTGTPAGVAKLESGDELKAEIVGVTRANWKVT